MRPRVTKKKSKTTTTAAWCVLLSALMTCCWRGVTIATAAGCTTRSCAAPPRRRNDDGRTVARMVVRGGGTETADDEEEDDEVAVATMTDTVVAVSVPTRTLRVLVRTARALRRALRAGFSAATAPSSAQNNEDDHEDDHEDEKSVSFVSKTWSVLTAMWDAALHGSNDDDDDVPATTTTPRRQSDMGDYLASAYGLSSSSSSSHTPAIMLGGSLSDALRTCRSQARLLVAFVPSSKPQKNKKGAFDVTCLESLRSEEVSVAVEAKQGSYMLWAAKYGSPEAVQAMKRLKQQKKTKFPTLVVAYPAQVIDNTGRPRILPKLLAQHHCNPPPSPTSLSSFLSALRKRHSAQIRTMRTQLREAEFHAERRSNYAASLTSDTQRTADEAHARVEVTRRQEEEQRRLEAVEARRQESRESLGEEPAVADGVVTIALRFADGRSGQRRFRVGDDAALLFRWVEGHFDWDRERTAVTDMRGDHELVWTDCDGKTKSVGDYVGVDSTALALRVSLTKEQEEEDGSQDDPVDPSTTVA